MALSFFQLMTLKSIKGLGDVTLRRLYDKSGQTAGGIGDSAAELGDFLAAEFKKAVALPEIVAAQDEARRVMEQAADEHILCLTPADDLFPDNLRSLVDTKFDKNTTFEQLGKCLKNNEGPLILFVRGNDETLSCLNAMPGIAMVGSRDCNESAFKAGKMAARFFAEQGFNIVSGMADGCDASAHEGALEVSQGVTTAILAQGLNLNGRSWSRSKREMAERILDHGGILMSEYPPDAGAERFNFIKRDRLQSGLADATLIISMKAQNCGTLKTLQCAAANQRPIFAVKYKKPDESYSGNELLLSGDPVISSIYHCRPLCFQQMEDISQELKAAFKLQHQPGAVLAAGQARPDDSGMISLLDNL